MQRFWKSVLPFTGISWLMCAKKTSSIFSWNFSENAIFTRLEPTEFNINYSSNIETKVLRECYSKTFECVLYIRHSPYSVEQEDYLCKSESRFHTTYAALPLSNFACLAIPVKIRIFWVRVVLSFSLSGMTQIVPGTWNVFKWFIMNLAYLKIQMFLTYFHLAFLFC